MGKLKTTEQFIAQAKEVHGETYDYSLVKYINSEHKVEIICKEHGVFKQLPHGHLAGRGCRRCGDFKNKKRYTTEQFISKLKEILGNEYDYSVTKFCGWREKIKIKCNKHDTFEQTPEKIFTFKRGCKECKRDKTLSTKSLFIKNPELSQEWHPTKNEGLTPKDVTYYHGEKVWWLCNKGHEWPATVWSRNRPNGNKCPYCSNMIVYSGNCLFNSNPELSKEWHPTKNGILTPCDVSPHSNKKVWWLCEKGHSFKSSISNRNVNNNNEDGSRCSVCSESKGERMIVKILLNNNIKYERQQKFDGCVNKILLRFDFYLPNINICIEYDGELHFEAKDFFGGIKRLKEIQKNDGIKNEFCLKNNIPLLRISYKENIEEKLTSFLCNKIKLNPVNSNNGVATFN
ncbi:MAG: zinc-ribbon domain-containing protein [bacterium]|nr:zinc-ribbon domain-containing protein [bacterium]